MFSFGIRIQNEPGPCPIPKYLSHLEKNEPPEPNIAAHYIGVGPI